MLPEKTPGRSKIAPKAPTTIGGNHFGDPKSPKMSPWEPQAAARTDFGSVLAPFWLPKALDINHEPPASGMRGAIE